MSCLDTCLTRLCGDRVPLETARKTFFFLLGIAIMLVWSLPCPRHRLSTKARKPSR